MKNKNVGIHENVFQIDLSSCKCISLMVYTFVSQSKGRLQEIMWYFHFFNFTIHLYLFVFLFRFKVQKKAVKGYESTSDRVDKSDKYGIFVEKRKMNWVGGAGSLEVGKEMTVQSESQIITVLVTLMCLCVCMHTGIFS